MSERRTNKFIEKKLKGYKVFDRRDGLAHWAPMCDIGFPAKLAGQRIPNLVTGWIPCYKGRISARTGISSPSLLTLFGRPAIIMGMISDASAVEGVVAGTSRLPPPDAC